MFEKSESLESLAKVVIGECPDLKHLDNPSLRIVYLYCDKDKTSNGKKVYADTTKLNDKTKAVAGCDFIVIFYKQICSTLDEDIDASRTQTRWVQGRKVQHCSARHRGFQRHHRTARYELGYLIASNTLHNHAKPPVRRGK